MTPVLEVEGLRFAYDGREVLSGVSFALGRGEFLGVIGPNGAGKTTLLRLLLGVLAPASGSARAEGAEVSRLPRRRAALKLALVAQGAPVEFGFPVREVVAMGRTPHLGRFQPEGERDRAAIRAAMEATETLALGERSVAELSGGERQRTLLARAFAQETPVLVLDEPTAGLDLRHQFQLLDQVRRRQAQGTAAVAALHDLNLAARYCDRLLALSQGRVAALGAPRDVLTPALLSGLFGVEAWVEVDPETGRPQVLVRGPA